MDIPWSFKNVCAGFYPHSDEAYTSFEDWVKGTVKGFVGDKDKPELRFFIDNLLNGQYTNKELEKIFQKSNPWTGFRDDGIRTLLSAIRKELD